MKKIFQLDWALIVPVFFLLLIGLVVLYSISFDGAVFDPSNLRKQIVSIIIGFVLLLFFSFLDYRRLVFSSTKIYFIMLLLLVAVLIFGKTIRGNTGWLGIYGYHIQPVEIAKVVMAIFLASFLSKKRTQLSVPTRIAASVILAAAPVLLVLKQPDLGSAVIILFSWGTLLTVSGIGKKNFLILAFVCCLLASSSWFLMKDYQKDRIANFLEPYRDPSGSGYNVIQSIVAVGSGGIFGKGLGHGSQSQLNFLPEKHTDFIFSVISEELGFVGAASVFILFGIIFWRLKETARLARDNFGYLLTVGVMAIFFFQLLINVGMNLGVMPVAGVPLPFLSYGGSSMVMVLASVGLVQSVYLRRIRE